MWQRINANRDLVRKPEGKAPLENLRTDGRIILKYLLKKQDGMALSCFFCLR
jgi:hypothetical protein